MMPFFPKKRVPKEGLQSLKAHVVLNVIDTSRMLPKTVVIISTSFSKILECPFAQVLDQCYLLLLFNVILLLFSFSQ